MAIIPVSYTHLDVYKRQIYGGVFTPTEAAAMAAIYSIPIGLWVYKACTFKGFLAMTKEATSTVGSDVYKRQEQEAVWVDHEYIWNLRVTA